VSAEELASWLDGEIAEIEALRDRYAVLKRPMRLTRGQEIELAVLRSVRRKLG
jgi:hypothetical protein